jgi:uncharacterized protein
MSFVEFNKILQSHINTLTYEKQFELALSVSKRLFPDYKDFFYENQWGDPDVLLDAIELCQQHKKETSENILKEMLLKVDSVTPHTEDFENASYALNACTSVYETLEFLIDNDQKHILNIGSYLTDTIDFKIQENNDLSEQQINNHPMMIEARNFLIGI